MYDLLVGLSSYQRSAEAWGKGVFKDEIVEVTIPGKRAKPSTVINEDEEYKKVNIAKFKKLATVFQVSLIKADSTATLGHMS